MARRRTLAIPTAAAAIDSKISAHWLSVGIGAGDDAAVPFVSVLVTVAMAVAFATMAAGCTYCGALHW